MRLLPASIPHFPPHFLTSPSQVRYDHHQARDDCGLKQILAEIIPETQKEVKEFRAQHGGFKAGEVSIDMVSVLLSILKHGIEWNTSSSMGTSL